MIENNITKLINWSIQKTCKKQKVEKIKPVAKENKIDLIMYNILIEKKVLYLQRKTWLTECKYKFK